MGRIDKEKFKLVHSNVDLFHSSEWEGDDSHPSTWYVVYRTCLALAMVTGISLHFVSTLETLGSKWFIYMTNQGISLLTLHYLLYAGIVVGKKITPDAVSPDHFPSLYSVSWGLQTCFTTVALFITIVYWIALHPYVVENHLIKGTWMEILNVFLHGINTASCVLDIMITARPIRIHHFYLAIIFGIYYTTFSLVYWAAGGTGVCKRRCEEVSPAPAGATCPVECDPFIYPILDWESKPLMAVGTVLASCVMMPVLQSVWWGVVWIRLKIKSLAS